MSEAGNELANEDVWEYIARLPIPDLVLGPPDREILRDGLLVDRAAVDRIVSIAATKASPAGWFVSVLRRAGEEGWPAVLGPGPGHSDKTRKRMFALAQNLRRAGLWTGKPLADRWQTAEEEWEAYVRAECDDAGVPSAAAEAVRAARAAVPKLAVAPPDSKCVTAYLSPSQDRASQSAFPA